MTFVSFAFLGLYGLVLAVRLTLGREGRGTAYLSVLLVASLFFYGWHEPAYLLLLAASIVVDYLAGLALAGSPHEQLRWRRGIVALSVAVNLGLLGTFKYADFITELLRSVFGLSAPAVAPGSSIGWVLPVGISFYTFQSMSYTFDVYQGRIAAERSLFRFSLFVCFFPQLVAGPIVRAGQFLRQLSRRRRLRARVFLEGSYLILRGFFLKMVVADNLGFAVDRMWLQASRDDPQGWTALLVVVLFSGQLFCDFAGYTDIARGLAYQLGFRLPINFRAPYVATSFSDFWGRWHITLSQWMRDYLYIPLGGSRKGRARGLVNLMVVMLISGLWHGAGLQFLVWGGIHGLAAALERVLGVSGWLRKPRPALPAARWLRSTGVLFWAVVVQVVWIGSMAFFRAADLDEGWRVLTNAAENLRWLATGEGESGRLDHVGLAALWFLVPVVLLHGRSWLHERSWLRLPGIWERAVYAGAMIYGLLALYGISTAFIYFQF